MELDKGYEECTLSMKKYINLFVAFAWESTASLQFRWLAQPLPHGLFVGEILVFLLFRGKLTKHANHGMHQDAVLQNIYVFNHLKVNLTLKK